LHRVLLERFRVQAPTPETVGCVERDRGEPRTRIPRNRAAFEGALRRTRRRRRDRNACEMDELMLNGNTVAGLLQKVFRG
jgi:hypothetical protein